MNFAKRIMVTNSIIRANTLQPFNNFARSPFVHDGDSSAYFFFPLFLLALFYFDKGLPKNTMFLRFSVDDARKKMFACGTYFRTFFPLSSSF